MSKHTTYRGVVVDMDSMRRENEKVPAVGNMPVNARGDKIKGGKVVQTADEIAREKNRVQSVVVQSGLKGPMPSTPETIPENKTTPKAATPTTKKTKEVELPSGDIVIEENKDE